MNCRHFILDSSGEPVPAPNLLRWCDWWQAHESRIHVGDTQVGPARVSTVFLMSDHNFGFKGGPVLWETMIFGGKLDEECERCGGSREQAEAMHQRWVLKAMEAEGVKGAAL